MKVLVGWPVSKPHLQIIKDILNDIAEIDSLNKWEELDEKIVDADIVISGFLSDEIILKAKN